ncbi:Os05g0464350 [Oryza sativa Japonica Group]|jgi:hypothetical protein|uniref:Os05g0464350 protein n=1 Tax=Oryza sativa subsp. japonica TaxID=39947 RepID=A0A0N7KKX6_ORYSJ|nr:hypothetical protein EE612_030036 [Oryza sativa]BAS94441.1 Os05g0464350 [Oryza sativa Japonica Group]
MQRRRRRRAAVDVDHLEAEARRCLSWISATTLEQMRLGAEEARGHRAVCRRRVAALTNDVESAIPERERERDVGGGQRRGAPSRS